MFNGNSNYSLSDLAAVTRGDGLGSFGGDGAWILILFILFAFGGFGGFGMGGWGNGMWPMMAGAGNFGPWGFDGMFPWLLASNANDRNATDAGFNSLALGNTLTGIQNSINSGFGDTALGIAGINQNICQTGNGIQNSLCQGFNSTNMAINGAQNAISQQMYANELASLNRSFAEQTANTQGFNGVQSQLAQYSYANREGLADIKYTIATENCADRAAVSEALRDVIAANTASTQRILDQLCQDKIDAKNDTISQLRQELLYARGQASQDVQTAAILAGQTNEVDALYNRLSSCPVPSTPVYGRIPIFTCNGNNGGCGCGYNNFVA